MYMLDDEGFRSRGGGMFSNIFRMHGALYRLLSALGLVQPSALSVRVGSVPWRVCKAEACSPTPSACTVRALVVPGRGICLGWRCL